MTGTIGRIKVGILAIGVIAATEISGRAVAGTYNPALNTLPEDQGWGLVEWNGSSPAPFVSDGILNQGLTSWSGYQFWERFDTIPDFAGPGCFDLLLSLKVIESSYGEGGFPDTWRPGFAVVVRDTAGRTVGLGITDNGLRLARDYWGTSASSSEFVQYDTTSDFRNYHLTIRASGISMAVDGVGIPELTLPLGDVESFASNEMWFGDGTSGGAGKWQLRGLRTESRPPLPPALIGDANGDCVVGAADYAIWAAQLGQTGATLVGDFDGDCTVSAADYALWAANFGKTCPPSAPTSVPEPTAFALMLMAIAVVWSAFRRVAPTTRCRGAVGPRGRPKTVELLV